MDNRGPNDPLTMYLRETAAVPPLSHAEEAELFRQLGQSDKWDDRQENAARRLVEAHLVLVVEIAGRRMASGIPLLDLIEEGNHGLMAAITGFAKKPTGAFSDYAAACIEDAISEAIAKGK